MATTVGIRELKLHAPGLVERAARGEQIVITRYGRPRARLGPADDAAATIEGSSSRMSEWQAEKKAFERALPRLERRYRDSHVALVGGRVVDADEDHEALFQRVWMKHPHRAFFIGRVGGPPAIVDMPGFEVE